MADKDTTAAAVAVLVRMRGLGKAQAARLLATKSDGEIEQIAAATTDKALEAAIGLVDPAPNRAGDAAAASDTTEATNEPDV
jgi:hypothetical protein